MMWVVLALAFLLVALFVYGALRISAREDDAREKNGERRS